MPAVRSVPLVGDEPAMRDWAESWSPGPAAEGVELTGDNGLLTALVRQVLQTGLEVEMTDHLGYEPSRRRGPRVGQQPQRLYPKTVTTEIGKVDLRVPRDRNGSFDPVTVPQGSASAGWADGQRDLAVRQGDDDRRHPGAPGRDLRDRDLPGHDLDGSPTPSSRTCWRGRTGRWTGSIR